MRGITVNQVLRNKIEGGIGEYGEKQYWMGGLFTKRNPMIKNST